jgi:hypothetical protein
VTNDLDTLATALYVRTDDLLKQAPDLAPWRPRVGITPKLTDAELVTLAVMQALLGFTSEARWIRHAHQHLGHLFTYLPHQSGYNKRLRRAASLITTMIRMLAVDTTLWSDDVWVVDSTPVECGRSKDTTRRSDLAGWAQYGYCASHSRYFWGLRLHLVCTLGGLPIGFALTGAKADERQTLLGILAADATLAGNRPGQILIGDRNYYGKDFEDILTQAGINLLRPARKGEPSRAGAHLFKPLRQTIESINQTFKAQLDLERHGGHTPTGVAVRVLQRILALTAAIWHNDKIGAPVLRSLTAYDHCCAARRFVIYPAQLGGTWRIVPGSDDLPGAERRRGQEHVRKAANTAKALRVGRCGTRAIWRKLNCLKPNLQRWNVASAGMTPETGATSCVGMLVGPTQPPGR